MLSASEGWEWYNKHIAYNVDKTGCVLYKFRNNAKGIYIPNGAPIDKVCEYFGIVLTVRYDETNYGFEYV